MAIMGIWAVICNELMAENMVDKTALRKNPMNKFVITKVFMLDDVDTYSACYSLGIYTGTLPLIL